MPPDSGDGFAARGWRRFPRDPDLLDWVQAVLPHARAAVRDPANVHWHVCQGTWFVGVDALANDIMGSVGESGPVRGVAAAWLRACFGTWPDLHPAQLSGLYPGYPQPRAGESAGAFRYRLRRDAAHVDGILAEGPQRRRYLREPHAFILGLPLTEADAGAAPLVVWPGSHLILGAAFAAAFSGHPPAAWPNIDLTQVYQEARQRVFDSCDRTELHARPGEAIVLHRHLLHGVAPWAPEAKAGPDGRLIAYFRPICPGGIRQWLGAA